jgi:Cdc6-like AAA superfamily ATPase
LISRRNSGDVARMIEPIHVGQAKKPIYLLPQMANRHGLIAGATETGKTVTLQMLAEGFKQARPAGRDSRRQHAAGNSYSEPESQHLQPFALQRP